MDSVSGRFHLRPGARWQDGRPVTGEEEGVGVRVVALSGFWLGRIPVGLLDRFVGYVPPVVTKWIEEMKGKGVDGQALLDEARAAIVKYTK